MCLFYFQDYFKIDHLNWKTSKTSAAWADLNWKPVKKKSAAWTDLNQKPVEHLLHGEIWTGNQLSIFQLGQIISVTLNHLISSLFLGLHLVILFFSVIQNQTRGRLLLKCILKLITSLIDLCVLLIVTVWLLTSGITLWSPASPRMHLDSPQSKKTSFSAEAWPFSSSSLPAVASPTLWNLIGWKVLKLDLWPLPPSMGLVWFDSVQSRNALETHNTPITCDAEDMYGSTWVPKTLSAAFSALLLLCFNFFRVKVSFTFFANVSQI